MDQAERERRRRYQRMVKEIGPKPQPVRDIARAFLVGGALALTGQFVYDYFRAIEPTDGEAVAATLAGMIVLGGLLTAFGVYDQLAEWGGAGAAVPITGFANTIVAAAMDFRREGWVLGMAAKMFVIAGPVIVFAVLTGFVVGAIKSAVLGLFP